MTEEEENSTCERMEILARFASKLVQGLRRSGRDLSWRQIADLKQARLGLKFLIRDLDREDDDFVLGSTIIDGDEGATTMRDNSQLDILEREVCRQVAEMTGKSKKEVYPLFCRFICIKDASVRMKRVREFLTDTTPQITYFQERPPDQTNIIHWDSSGPSRPADGLDRLPDNSATYSFERQVYAALNEYLCARSEIYMREQRKQRQLTIARRRLERLQVAA